MTSFSWLLLLLVGGPTLGIGAVLADARSGGRPASNRRLVTAGAVGGALSSGAGGCVAAMMPEGVLLLFPVALVGGIVCGAGLGGFAVLVRGALVRHRDRTV